MRIMDQQSRNLQQYQFQEDQPFQVLTDLDGRRRKAGGSRPAATIDFWYRVVYNDVEYEETDHEYKELKQKIPNNDDDGRWKMMRRSRRVIQLKASSLVKQARNSGYY